MRREDLRGPAPMNALTSTRVELPQKMKLSRLGMNSDGAFEYKQTGLEVS